MTIAAIISTARRDQGSCDDWLYIVGDPTHLHLGTEAELAAIDILEEGDDCVEILPAGFEARGLHSTIDYSTLRQCLEWGDRLAGTSSDTAALDILRYYLRFDAFPEQLGAPDPPPPEVTLSRLDREFYELLGEERPGTHCRHEGCHRGTVQYSVLCRPHHFESIKGRPSPFTD